MKTTTAVLAALLLTSAGCRVAHACGEADGKMKVYSLTDDGGTYQLILDAAAIARTPSWAPGSGEPPLSITKVVSAVSSWAKQYYPNADEIRVRSVDLKIFQCTNNHWYYQVELMPIANGRSMAGVATFAGVLMDASIVEPTLLK